MKFFQVLLLLSILALSSGDKTRFRNVKCVPLNNTILKVRYCYIKAYSRNYASMNFGITRTIAAVKPHNVGISGVISGVDQCRVE